jgi:hypothetical protein
MIRNTCFASQIFWDSINHDRILVERHRFNDDPTQQYVFYKTKFATIRSRSAAVDPAVSAEIHHFIGRLYPAATDLVRELDEWLAK